MNKPSIETVDDLFNEALLLEDDVNSVIDDDNEDQLLGYMESTRKISIFDSDYVMEGEEL